MQLPLAVVVIMVGSSRPSKCHGFRSVTSTRSRLSVSITSAQQQRQHHQSLLLSLHAMNQDPMRHDISVTFGSDDPDDFGTDEDEFRAEQALRKAKIDALLQQQDVEFKEQRRLKKWGKFANATSKEEIQSLEEQERRLIAQGKYKYSPHIKIVVHELAII